MKYNSIDNAHNFISDQILWCKANHFGDFTFFCNGNELCAMIDDDDIVSAFQRGDLKTKGYWEILKFRNGIPVAI